MTAITCPLCGSGTDTADEPFATVDDVIGHIDDSSDGPHEGERGSDYREAIEAMEAQQADSAVPGSAGAPTLRFDGDEPTIVYADEDRPLGAVLADLDDHVGEVHTKFRRVVQEQQEEITRLEETVEAQKLAIQELQAGMEALAEEHDKDVEYQFEL